MYKINVDDREYSVYSIVDSQTLKKMDIDINALQHKLFTQDIFKICEDNTVIIEHSSVRSMSTIPAVLVLEGNRMFGRYKDRFLYKCIPDDRRLPVFLVPYRIKPGFSKKLTNKYITFEFRHWKNKHPMGVITQTLGNVSDLTSFYEYQLYCKSLYASIQNFTKQTMKQLKNKSEDEFVEQMIQTYILEDRRTSYDIITIDPKGSKDFDDGFSLENKGEQYVLSIYIANVSLWMDTLDLWDSFSNRIATIYLPDRKRPMLPTVLSDALCSLQEHRTRFAFTLDIYIDSKTFEIVNVKFLNTIICVRQNLRYDTPEQEQDATYIKSLDVIRNLNKKYNYMDSIDTSHEFIAYIMILMNYLTAKEMKNRKIGIYRSAKYNIEFKPPENVSSEVRKFLKMWNSSGGSYVKYENISGHDILDLDAYVHITSPIRRLVDLLNIIKFQEDLNIFKNAKASTFYNRWTDNTAFEYINTTMRSIRKIQNDCSLLKLCTNDKKIMEAEHDTFIFDKIVRNDSLYQYMVYIPDINMVNRVTSRHDLQNYSQIKCKLYLFTDEIRLKTKIRISLIL
jgi:exoribonuclease R